MKIQTQTTNCDIIMGVYRDPGIAIMIAPTSNIVNKNNPSILLPPYLYNS